MAVSEKLRKKLEKRRDKLKQGAGLGFVTFKEGTTRIRILSAGVDSDFCIEATNFYLGKEIGGFISPATFGEPCKALETYTELKDEDDDDNEQVIKDLKPKKGYFAAVLVLDEKGKTVEKEPSLAKLTKGMYEELIEYMLDEEQGDFTDYKEGYDVKVKRSGKGQFDTEYTLVPCKPSKLDKKYAGPYDLEKMLRGITASYDETVEMVDKYFGGGADDEEDKKSSKKSSKGKKSSKPSSDLDGPAKKKKKKKVADDEEKPKKKKKKK